MKSVARILFTLLLAFAACANLPARGLPDRLTFGAEWGYTASLYNNWHYNYLSPEGIRIDDKGQSFILHNNASIYGFVGANLLSHSNISLMVGYAGIQQDVRVVPVGLRYTYFLKGWGSDGMFVYAQPEIGFHVDDANPSGIAMIGAGHRYMLNHRMSLNINGGLQFALDSPGIFDEILQDYVPDTDVRLSEACYTSLILNVSVNF